MNRLPLLLLLPFYSIAAEALEFDLAATLGAEYTTNTNNAPSGFEMDEFIVEPGIFLGATHSGPTLELAGDYLYERRIYQENIYSDENVVTGLTNVLWHALPERLDVEAGNTRIETTRNPRGAFNQANRQILSTTFLSPTLRFRIRQSDEIQIQYRYTDLNADETRTDSQEQLGAVRYILALSPNRALTAEYNQRKIDYGSGFIPSIDAREQFLEYSQEGPDLELRLRGGHTVLERTGSADAKGAIGELGGTWRLTAATSLTLTAIRDITDRSANLVEGESAFGRDVFEETSTADIYTVTSGNLGISHNFGATIVGINAIYEKNDYEETPNDRRRRDVGLTAERQLTPTTSMAAFYRAGKDEFLNDDTEVDRQTAGIELSWALARKLDLQFRVSYLDSERVSGLATSYTEWRGMVNMSYYFVRRNPR